MRCLITGGAGFIGSQIQDKLLENGHDVTIIDNLSSGKKSYLNPKSKFYQTDIRDKDKVNQAFAEFKPEAVFHLAAQIEVGYSMEHPLEDNEINVLGFLNILESAKNAGAKKIIYSNTGGAFYGEVPLDKLPVVEDFPVDFPSSFYGTSKYCAEMYLKLYGNVYKIPWVSLRYANVYGPRQEGNKESGIVAIFTQKFLNNESPTINGNGEHTRDYVFVTDVVDANIKALDYPGSDYFNISTGTRISNLEVFETVKAEFKSNIKVKFGPNRAGDVLDSSLSPQKAADKLGWKPKFPFKEGIRETVKYYLPQKS